MEACWARAIGGCGSKLSREHYVSKSLWPEPSIDAVGFPWCKDEPKRIGLGSLTSKILCDVHNNTLSPLDAAAGAAMDTLRRVVAFGKKPPARKSKRGVRFQIDGPLLERWFLKVAIGLSQVRKDKAVWRYDKTPLATPSANTVRWVFGSERFKPPMGLYMAADVHSGLNFHDSVEAGPLYYNNEGLIGFLFGFFGLQFILWIADPAPPSPLYIPWKRAAGSTARDLHRHMRFIRFSAGKHTTHFVDFLWLEQPIPMWLR